MTMKDALREIRTEQLPDAQRCGVHTYGGRRCVKEAGHLNHLYGGAIDGYTEEPAYKDYRPPSDQEAPAPRREGDNEALRRELLRLNDRFVQLQSDFHRILKAFVE